jgi:hypothetical protein
MIHLLLLAALLAGLQPALTGVGGWNGGTLLALILLTLWVVLARRALHKQH